MAAVTEQKTQDAHPQERPRRFIKKPHQGHSPKKKDKKHSTCPRNTTKQDKTGYSRAPQIEPHNTGQRGRSPRAHALGKSPGRVSRATPRDSHQTQQATPRHGSPDRAGDPGRTPLGEAQEVYQETPPRAQPKKKKRYWIMMALFAAILYLWEGSSWYRQPQTLPIALADG